MSQELSSISHYARRAIIAAWLITLLTLSACAGERRPPPTAAPPIIMIPVTRTHPTPTVTPLAMATPVEQSDNQPLPDLVPYTLPEVGIALDYFAAWTVIDVSPDIRAQSSRYAITFNAEPAEEDTPRSIPKDETKFDLVILKSSATSAQAAATQRKEELAQDATAATILAETALTLPSGLQVIRLELEGRFGPALEYITALNGYTVLLSGLGNFTQIETIANSLRLAE